MKDIKEISTEEFLTLGIRNVAYIKEIDDAEGTRYCIHAADGTPLSVMPDLSQAIATLEMNQLLPVTLQ